MADILEELAARLRERERRLHMTADERGRSVEEQDRLHAKATGVGLALSFVEEARREAAQSGGVANA